MRAESADSGAVSGIMGRGAEIERVGIREREEREVFTKSL